MEALFLDCGRRTTQLMRGSLGSAALFMTHSGSQMDEWVEIVPPVSREDAEAAFRNWKASHPALSSSLRDQDVRIDVIRAQDGSTSFRYMVRTSAAKS